MLKRASLLVCAASMIVAAGCRQRDAQEAPVATPALALDRDRVAIGSPVRLTYRFEIAPGAKFDADYWVFVHVMDPQGERLWVDDHLPPTPTSTWKPGDKIEYSRTVFVPNYPYIGPAAIRLGLYDQATNKRFVLNAQEVSRREYSVAKFELLPQSENVFLIYKEGWHPAEIASSDPSVEWQWTKKSATISFRNPKKDSTLYLEYDARTDQFSPPQQVTIRIGGSTVATFAADSRSRRLVTFPVTAAQLGTGEITEMTLDVDRTFTPGGGDTRELGIRVYHAFVQPK